MNEYKFFPRLAWKFVGSGDDQLFEEVDYFQLSFIFQAICIAGLKTMFDQWKMSSPSGDFSVASHVDWSRTLSFLN